jgi:hypothetical protein
MGRSSSTYLPGALLVGLDRDCSGVPVGLRMEAVVVLRSLPPRPLFGALTRLVLVSNAIPGVLVLIRPAQFCYSNRYHSTIRVDVPRIIR